MKYIIIIFITLNSCLLFSQNENRAEDRGLQKQIAFRHLTIEQGLSQNTILSIAQDSIGYMWFATQNGLNKYNGKSFNHYNKQFQNVTRSTFSRLGKVYVDKQNQLWIVSGIGQLERYQPETDDFKAVQTNFEVSNVFQDKAFNMYLGTYANGIYKIDAKTKDTLQILKASDSSLTSYYFQEIDDVIYAATSKGIISINNNDYSFLKTPIPENTNVSTMVVNASKSMFIGTYGQGLYIKPSASEAFLKLTKLGSQQLPSDLNIEAMLIDRWERLWIATYGNGLYVLDFKAETIQQFTAQKNNPFAVHYNDILCLFEDSTGNIWLGTDGAGSSYFDEHLVKFNLLTNKQLPLGVNVDVIRSITTDDKNNIWLGTSGHGLTYIDLQSGNHHTMTIENSKINSDRVVSLAYVNKMLWIGHQNSGLNILDANGTFQSFPELQSATIWKIVPVNKNQVWLATERSGVILFDKDKGILKQFNKNNSDLGSNNIRALVREDTNTLWLGSIENGLYKIDLNTDLVYKIPDINDDIKALLYQDDILWIGTSGNGLKRLDIKTQVVEVFTMNDGLPNEVVYSVLPDSDGNFWLSTNYGLCKFTYKEGAKPEVENYTNLNGLQGLEFNTGAYYKNSNGILYFGGLEGVNWFEPNQITTNNIKPQTVITGIDIFNEPVNFSKPLELKFKENTVTFTFSGLHFSQPERNLYRYKLVNNDEDWIQSGNNNVAHYTNLPPNDYEFQVYSSNYDGVWDDTPAVYKFSIMSPWFATTMAKWIYALLISMLMYAIYAYLKFRWEVRSQLQLEHAETERLKKLDEFKTRLYTNISHEFRTPLTLISGPINKQLSKPNITEEEEKDFSLIQRNSERLLNLVNQLLDLSKIESGSLKLEVTQGNLSLLLQQIVAAFKFKAEEKHINFSCQIATIKKAWYDKDVIEKIVTNLLTNAIKYVLQHGEVTMKAVEKDGQLILTIINNGNTITDNQLGKLFQRFYQANNTSDGDGIGLSLVKELCILSHGNIVAHTMNEDDIQFTVTLPIERSFYNQSEINFEDEVRYQAEKDVTISKDVSTTNGLEDVPVLLIIEDEKEVRHFVSSIFSDTYSVLEAANGKQGIAMAIKHIPDLIISDIMMPEADGIEVCNVLKHDERTSHIPIILLTAKVGEENELTGLKTGADDYITKPFSNEKLKIRVEKLIELRKKLQQYYGNTFEIGSKETTMSSVEQKFLERMHEVLDEHITNPEFNTEEFGEKMLMSRMQLHRKLKALTGLSASEFLRNERLKLAVKLIQQSDNSVSEVAYEVGFNTPSYFIKCFKEVYGVTPNDYLTNS